MTHMFTSSGLFGTLLHDPQVAACFAPNAFVDKMLAFERAWTKALAASAVVSDEAAEAALLRMVSFAPD